MKLAVLMACHNRKAKTIVCLEALYKNQLPKQHDLHVILFDDGSTDNTSAAVRGKYPCVKILQGDGHCYWNKSMYHAFKYAKEIGFDCYIWLNDDTILFPNAIKSMISTWQDMEKKGDQACIFVGSTQDPNTGNLTYGGLKKENNVLRLLKFTLVKPQVTPVKCHSMNGNCVLIPDQIVKSIGVIERNFAHAFGDIDYGLRAKKAGFNLWVVPGYVGKCSRNSINATFNDRTLPLRLRWKKMMEPKGLPPASWLLFTRRHTGIFWPIYFIWPYFKLIFK